MADRETETKQTEKDSKGNKTETTQTERERTPANPSAPASDTPKRGSGSGTNPSGLGGNEESVSG